MRLKLTNEERATLAELAQDESERCFGDEADVRTCDGDEKANETREWGFKLAALAVRLRSWGPDGR